MKTGFTNTPVQEIVQDLKSDNLTLRKRLMGTMLEWFAKFNNIFVLASPIFI